MSGKPSAQSQDSQSNQGRAPQPAIPIERIAKLAYEKWLKGGCKHGCDQQAWLEAEAELMKAEMERKTSAPSLKECTWEDRNLTGIPHASSKRKSHEQSIETFEELGRKLEDADPEIREYARAKFALYGGERLLALVNSLDSELPKERSAARDEFFGIFTSLPFSPNLRKTLESEQRETRLEAIREIAMVLRPVRDAIDAHVPGWEILARLTREQGKRDNPDPHMVEDEILRLGDQSEPITEDRLMEAAKKLATTPAKQTIAAETRSVAKATLTTPRVHLIRIPNDEAMNRAVMTLGDVRVPYCGFADSRLLVADEHIDALRRDEIPFVQLS